VCYICGHHKQLCAVDFRCPYHCAPTEHESVAEHVEQYWIERELEKAASWHTAPLRALEQYWRERGLGPGAGSGAARGEEKTAPLLAHNDPAAAPPPGLIEG